MILLDIQMSDLDGHEVCRRLRANPLTSKIPIVFVTARSGASDEEFGLNLGAVAYIAKPFSAAIVRARVATHLRLKRQIDLLEQYALLDGLTGIPNRRHFDDLLTQEVRRCLRDQVPLSVIMIDIDDFKCVRYGLTRTAPRGTNTSCRVAGTNGEVRWYSRYPVRLSPEPRLRPRGFPPMPHSISGPR